MDKVFGVFQAITPEKHQKVFREYLDEEFYEDIIDQVCDFFSACRRKVSIARALLLAKEISGRKKEQLLLAEKEE